MGANASATEAYIDFGASEEVTLYVGDEEQAFLAHRGILEKDSPYFTTALNSQFEEGLYKMIHLTVYEPITINAYLRWAYTGQLVFIDSKGPKEVERDKDATTKQALAAKLYCFAHYVQNIKLQNHILDYLIQNAGAAGANSPDETLTTIYDDLPEDSKLRKYVIDGHLANASDWLMKNVAGVSATFLQDLTVAWGKAAKGGNKNTAPKDRGRCHYHVHNAEVPSCG